MSEKAREQPLIVGLTGGIGMGKSTVGRMLESRGIELLDADKIVHELYSKGGAAVGPIGDAFPTAIVNEAVSRPALSACIVGNPEALARLESIVHPLVSSYRREHIEAAAAYGTDAVVVDIPLLFETGAEQGCDLVVVVSAPAEIQRGRVLKRPGMTPGKFDALVGRQMADSERRRRADVIIDTGGSLGDTGKQVEEFVASLSLRPRHAFQKLIAQDAELD